MNLKKFKNIENTKMCPQKYTPMLYSISWAYRSDLIQFLIVQKVLSLGLIGLIITSEGWKLLVSGSEGQDKLVLSEQSFLSKNVPSIILLTSAYSERNFQKLDL